MPARLTSIDFKSRSKEEPPAQQTIEQGLIEFVVRPVDDGRFRGSEGVGLSGRGGRHFSGISEDFRGSCYSSQGTKSVRCHPLSGLRFSTKTAVSYERFTLGMSSQERCSRKRSTSYNGPASGALQATRKMDKQEARKVKLRILRFKAMFEERLHPLQARTRLDTHVRPHNLREVILACLFDGGLDRKLGGSLGTYLFRYQGRYISSGYN